MMGNELPQTFWAYFAGFFDGEGNVYYLNSASRLQIAQSGENGKLLMEQFRAILKDQCRLPGKIRVIPAKTKRQISYRLRIHHRVSVRYISERMLPFLRIKKVVIQDLLRFFLLFPKNQGWNKFRLPTCGRGHAYTEESTGYKSKIRKDGPHYRYCKICNRDRMRLQHSRRVGS